MITSEAKTPKKLELAPLILENIGEQAVDVVALFSFATASLPLALLTV